MWYEFTAYFESDRELIPGDFKAMEAAIALTNSLNQMGIPIRHINRMSLTDVRTEQESRLAHPSSKPSKKRKF